jgi:hypothetical protein
MELGAASGAANKIVAEIDAFEELFGAAQPFCHPLFWAPVAFSGLHTTVAHDK